MQYRALRGGCPLSGTGSELTKPFKIFSGNANREIAEDVCRYLDTTIGRANVKRFADGESDVEISENVRGSTASSSSRPARRSRQPDGVAVMIDALKRASAGSIIAVMPYFGYARQDRKTRPRTPISRAWWLTC